MLPPACELPETRSGNARLLNSIDRRLGISVIWSTAGTDRDDCERRGGEVVDLQLTEATKDVIDPRILDAVRYLDEEMLFGGEGRNLVIRCVRLAYAQGYSDLAEELEVDIKSTVLHNEVCTRAEELTEGSGHGSSDQG